MKKTAYLILIITVLVSQTCLAATPPQAGIATAHPLATDAGKEILDMGGNAFDAAVAVTAALAVVEPAGSGLGGGGFWLLHRASDKFETMVDGREKAPQKAHRDMYLDEKGNVIDGLSISGPLAAGIPGTVAAMVHIAEKYGRLSLAKSLAPAIRHARNGFTVDRLYQRMTNFRLQDFNNNEAAEDIFLLDSNVPPIGHVIKQPDLARVLESIAKKGRHGFYAGEVAEKLVKGVRDAGGIWTLQDLRDYQVVEREPVRGQYLDITITSAPPPSSGGIALMTIMNILARFDLVRTPAVIQKHLVIEAMRRAYRDRAEFLGDPDYFKVPVERLLSQQHAGNLASDISSNRATPSNKLKPATLQQAGKDTTHFSVIDKEGNRVAATMSINYPFGAVFVPPGTGVLLNDEMDDFSSKPGSPNAYGLVGGEANAIEPGKRPLSSMSPSFLESKNRVAIVGTPGGSRIITMVLLAALEFQRGGDAVSMVGRKRFHHQYLPDTVQYEPGALNDDEIKQLGGMGHALKTVTGVFGNMQAVLWDKRKNTVQAASDPRAAGKAIP